MRGRVTHILTTGPLSQEDREEVERICEQLDKEQAPRQAVQFLAWPRGTATGGLRMSQ